MKVKAPASVIDPGSRMLFNAVHPAKTRFPPVAVNPSGSSTDSNFVQPLNVSSASLATNFGITTFVRVVQFLKAELPMLVTPAGITIVFNDEHPSNAAFPIVVTLVGIVISLRLLHPWNNPAFTVLHRGSTARFHCRQPANAYSPISVTCERSCSGSFGQSAKAYFSISLTERGNTNDARPEQPRNASLRIHVIPSGRSRDSKALQFLNAS